MQELLNRHTHGIKAGPDESSALTPGRSTGECLGNGARLAVIALIERAVRDAGEEYDCDFRCIITGGGANLFLETLALPFEYEPELVLNGIMIVSGDGR